MFAEVNQYVPEQVQPPSVMLPFDVLCEFRYDKDQDDFMFVAPSNAQSELPLSELRKTVTKVKTIMDGVEMSQGSSDRLQKMLIITVVACLLTCGCALFIAIPVLIAFGLAGMVESHQKMQGELEELIRKENGMYQTQFGLTLVLTEHEQPIPPHRRHMHSHHHHRHHRHSHHHHQNMNMESVITIQVKPFEPDFQQQPYYDRTGLLSEHL